MILNIRTMLCFECEGEDKLLRVESRDNAVVNDEKSQNS